MATAISGSKLVSLAPSNEVVHSSTTFERACNTVKKGFKSEGLVGDGANALKLANFWSEVASGTVSETSKKMTECGSVIKNYLSFLELPSKVSAMVESFDGLQRGTAESVAVFVTAVLATGKACFEGIELAGTRFGLLEKNVVAFFQPLSSSSALS